MSGTEDGGGNLCGAMDAGDEGGAGNITPNYQETTEAGPLRDSLSV